MKSNNMIIIVILLAACQIIGSAQKDPSAQLTPGGSEFFDEKLSIYQFQNQKALLDFEYTFTRSDGAPQESDSFDQFAGLFPQ